VAAPLTIANLPSGQWNRCEVECNWPRLRISLNGKVIHDIDMNADEALRYRLRKGYIGIQNIGCKAYFRNIQIKRLPDKEQWTHLLAFGMEGFRTEGDSDWQIQNDVLTGKGNDGTAISRQQFEGPYELQVWVKTIVNGNGGVLFNYGTRHVEVQCFNAPDSTNPTGSLYGIAPASRPVATDQQWFLLQIFNNGPKAMVMVNGERVCETDKLQPPYKGSIAFQQHTPNAVIHYRGAMIKRR
ncbi:MAG: 3-keto-disaccharide hydrolase, partial [Planctomycetota bacterium]